MILIRGINVRLALGSCLFDTAMAAAALAYNSKYYCDCRGAHAKAIGCAEQWDRQAACSAVKLSSLVDSSIASTSTLLQPRYTEHNLHNHWKQCR